MDDIIIDNFHIGYWDGFNHPDEAVLCIDYLINDSCRSLINKYRIKSKIEYFYFILSHISKLFNIDRRKLTGKWVSTFGCYECFKDLRSNDGVKYRTIEDSCTCEERYNPKEENIIDNRFEILDL